MNSAHLIPTAFLRNPMTRLLVAGVLLFTLSSCRSTPDRPMPDISAQVEEWERRAEESRPRSPAVAPLPILGESFVLDPAPETDAAPRETDAALRETDAAPRETGETEPRKEVPEPPKSDLPTIPVTSLIIPREIDSAVLFRTLADAADINILLGDGIGGPVKVKLNEESTWDKVFLSAIASQSLHYEWRNDILHVMTVEDIERQTMLERVLRERNQAESDRKSAEPMILELYRVNYADARRLAASISQTLAGVNRTEGVATSILADEDSGLLIVHATPSNVERFRKLAQALDRPARQVLIEATIVQANSETARELGFQWGVLHSAADQGRVGIGTTGNPDGFNSNFPAGFDPAGAGFSFGVERISSHQILQAQLTALQRDGRLNIIASPSITTLDKQTAVIESGEERPFESATGTGISAVATVEFKRAVLRLEVVPQIIDGRWIKLNIDTTKDEFDDSRGVVIEGSLQVPIITRSASTLLYLEDGETTVIGGLSSHSESDTETGIPVLKDLPGLGRLFRSNSRRTALSDTLIFITPHILPADVPPPQESE